MIPLVSIQSLTLVLYSVAMAQQLTMYCWFGNEVVLKSISIGEACYVSKWYNLSPSLRRHIFLIMERAKRPLVIHVHKFSHLSLTAFGTIIHWSYSYFALLRRLYYASKET